MAPSSDTAAPEANIRPSIGGRLGGSVCTSIAGLGMEGLNFDDDEEEKLVRARAC